MYCELVRGLGEAIVSGTVPGTALTFVARKDDIDAPRVGGWLAGSVEYSAVSVLCSAVQCSAVQG